MGLVIEGHHLSCGELNKGETYDVKYAEYETVEICRAQTTGPLEGHLNSLKYDASGFSTGAVIGNFVAAMFVLGIAMVVVRRKRWGVQSRRIKGGSSVALNYSANHPSMFATAAMSRYSNSPVSMLESPNSRSMVRKQQASFDLLLCLFQDIFP